MKGHYDPEADAIYLSLSDKPVVDTDEPAPGFLIDLDADGHVVGIEILHASDRVDNPSRIDFETFRVAEPLRKVG